VLPILDTKGFFMEQTIVGVFDTKRQANDARSLLRDAGFSNVEVQNKSEMTSDATGADAHGNGGGIAGFFLRLFGTEDHPDAEQYSESPNRRGWIVVVQVASDAEADCVTAVMEDSGAVDVEHDSASTSTPGAPGERTEIASRIQSARSGIQSGGYSTQSDVCTRPLR
jgi:hypothetical protein